MKLHITEEWLRCHVDEDEPGGLMACSPELYAKITGKEIEMTTKVKVEIVQKHMPVIVEVLRNDGSIGQTQMLSEIGNAAEEYVHSGQTLRVREMTTEEKHNLGL